ncbi:MAG TPA: hypothetical protein ENJ37_10325 [Deltaproteobacteria bacterium]|nr:hypothetical protein [Deltaproteobacteria bacterium]
MATWAKIKFFYDTMLGSPGSTLSATSTESGGDYHVDYIHNMLETNRWLAEDDSMASTQYITYDAGAGNAAPADYLAVAGHNLYSAGASIVLQYSTDNFVSDINDAFAAFAPASDKAILREFASPGAYRYWRLVISGLTATAPYLSVCIWGTATELDYATASFDPNRQEVRAKVNRSYGGYVTGVHTMYAERIMTLRFSGADPSLYSKIDSWWESSGQYLKNLFVGWETANNPDDIYLMRPEPRYDNPFTGGGLYRDITITLRGRKE